MVELFLYAFASSALGYAVYTLKKWAGSECMDRNVLVPLILFCAMIVAWLVCEWRGGRVSRIASGLLCIACSGAFAAIVMNVEEIVIGRHVSALIHVDEGLKQMELGRVQAAVTAYREKLNATDDPRAAVFAMEKVFQEYNRGQAARR